MQVDEAGRDDELVAVDDPRRAGRLELADRDDPPPLDGHVTDGRFAAAAVVDRPAAEDEVGFDGVGREERGQEEHRGGHKFPVSN